MNDPHTEKKEMISSPRSIIALTREHIGDLVCTTPALRSLRRLYPNAYIAVEVGERAAGVLKNNPHVDEIIGRPDRQGLLGKGRFISQLRRRKFDLAVILDDSSDMILHVWMGGVPTRAGIITKRWAKLLTHGVPFDPGAHEMIDNFRNVVAMLGGNISDAQPEVFPDEEDRRAVDTLFAELRIRPEETLIALNPGASAPANRWLPERFAELADLLVTRPSTRILLLGGTEDMPLAREICCHTRFQPTILTGRLSLLQLATALHRCHLLVTADTGPMHLACAVRTPIVSLFGPAIPHESGPCYVQGNVAIRKVSGCPTCTKYVCRENKRCMRAITAQEVFQVVEDRLRCPA